MSPVVPGFFLFLSEASKLPWKQAVALMYIREPHPYLACEVSLS